MEKGDQVLVQIEKYLFGQMESEELIAFEKDLAMTPELQQELALQKDLRDGIQTFGNRNLKVKLKGLHKELIEGDKTSTAKKKTNLWIIVGFILVMLLIAFALYFSFIKTELEPQKLYAQYYEPFELNVQNRDTKDQLDLSQASELYQSKSYSSALPQLENLVDLEPSNTQIVMALANCQLNLGYNSQAIINFKKIILLNDPYLIDQARWYLSLSYLNANEIQSCKEELAILADKADADFNAEAKELLLQISEL